MRGRDGGGGGLGSINVLNSTDVWTYRHGAGNAPFSDSINNAMRTIDDDFPGFSSGVNTVDAVELGGKRGEGVLGFWSPADKQLAINQRYTDQQKMNDVMDSAARSGFHPSRGNKSGTEAVALHEAGHALTDHLANKHGFPGLHAFSEKVVHDAMHSTGQKTGVSKFAGKISKYAQENYAETVAEAVADWYCNGYKSSTASQAIMAQLNKYK